MSTTLHACTEFTSERGFPISPIASVSTPRGSPRSTGSSPLGDQDYVGRVSANVSIEDASSSNLSAPPIHLDCAVKMDVVTKSRREGGKVTRVRVYDLLSLAFVEAQERCATSSASPFANLKSLYHSALEIASSNTSGLKRFAPIGIEPPAFGPGSKLPDIEKITYFHSSYLPPMRLVSFANTVLTSLTGMSPELLAAALVLFNRADSRLRKNHGSGVTLHMMHRLFAACLVVAIKLHGDDCGYDPYAFSQATQLGFNELVRMELQLVKDLDWNLHVSRSDIDDLFAAVSQRIPA